MLSSLYFSADKKNEDGYLTAAELYEMDIDVDLVVLSACNTGVGKYNYASGPMNLARAFAYSGAKSTILSTWPAPDQATSILFPTFYSHLINGDTKDVALQAAKTDWLANTGDDLFNHPYYWNAFSLWGLSDGLNDLAGTGQASSTMIFLILASMVLVGIAIWRLNRTYRIF